MNNKTQKPNTMKKRLKYLTYALIAMATITACKKDKDDPVTPTTPPENEEELITTLKLHFHSIGGTEHKHFMSMDLDGFSGPNAPVITADTLSADTMYHVEIEVLNESESPAEDITAEIQTESDVHQFFFQVSGANATVAYADTDANGLPIGLESMWTIGAASNGTVLVTLRHEPDKTAAGVSSGDISNAGGDTDIAVSFPVVIE